MEKKTDTVDKNMKNTFIRTASSASEFSNKEAEKNLGRLKKLKEDNSGAFYTFEMMFRIFSIKRKDEKRTCEGWKDRRTDGLTDRRTNRWTKWVLESRSTKLTMLKEEETGMILNQ